METQQLTMEIILSFVQCLSEELDTVLCLCANTPHHISMYIHEKNVRKNWKNM